MKRLLKPLLFLLLISPVFGRLQDLTINADKISYEKDKNLLEAEGSVEAVYHDVAVRGSHLIYDTSAESVYLDRGFTLNYAGLTLEGASLNYNFRPKTGRATDVGFLYQGVKLGGARLSLDEERFQLGSATFTTCDLGQPHYHVSAGEINLFQAHGWLVAYWGFFWLGNIPVVPMPTYIYDFRAQERERKNLPPFPEVGSNDEDGSFINEKLAWHLRRELSGSYSLGYAANKGLMLGLLADYLIDDRNSGNLRLDWNTKNQLFGGLTHHYGFSYGSLQMLLTSRERINYQRVSSTPDLRLALDRPGMKHEYRVGLLVEEGNLRLLRGGAQLKFLRQFSSLTPSFNLEADYYSNGARWLKPAVGIDLSGQGWQVGYLHYLLIDGASPFLHEQYRFRAADTLRPQLRLKIGETDGKIAASYWLDDWSPQDIDYSLFFRLHCYNLEVTYRSLRREFQLGVSLAGN